MPRHGIELIDLDPSSYFGVIREQPLQHERSYNDSFAYADADREVSGHVARDSKTTEGPVSSCRSPYGDAYHREPAVRLPHLEKIRRLPGALTDSGTFGQARIQQRGHATTGKSPFCRVLTRRTLGDHV